MIEKFASLLFVLWNRLLIRSTPWSDLFIKLRFDQDASAHSGLTTVQISKTSKLAAMFLIVLVVLLVPLHVNAQAIENLQFFGSEPASHETSEGRNITSCLKGWRQFLAAGVGFEDFTDYWRDFFLWPSHYADVANVQNQLNQTRYAVMAAFLRCDLERLKSVTDNYYKLEAELYFARHFVDTGGGFVKVLTENPGDRKKFVNEMMDYMILLKPAGDPDAERALYGGYFDLFTAQYADRARRYASFGDDPIYEELVAKWDELLETFKLFGDLGGEVKALTNEAIVEPAQSIGKAVVEAYNNPVKALKAAGSALISRFDACASTHDNRYCLSDIKKKAEDPFEETNRSEPRTFQQVLIAVEKNDVQRTEDIDKAEMLARYEMLYGNVNGDGVKTLVRKMDELIAILGRGREGGPGVLPIAGSLPPLQKIQHCAETVKGNVCR